MFRFNQTTISVNNATLPFAGTRAYAFQLLLISAAVILPVAAHALGAPVLYFLPMHWAIILSGLVYGWKSGALTGFLSPIISFFITGFPLLFKLPSMTLELLTYGLVVGYLIERKKVNPWIALAISLLAGRIVFVISFLAVNGFTLSQIDALKTSLLSGMVAAICQIALLPLVAKWWIKKEKNN